MNIRRALVLTSVLLMTGLLSFALSLARAAQGKGEAHEFELVGGRKVAGVLMRLHPEALLLQSERECLLVSSDDVRKVDGHSAPAASTPLAARVPLRQDTFERVLPSGEVAVHSTFVVTNHGTTPITETDWRLAAHEFSYLQDYRVVDEFGSELSFRVVDEPASQRKRIVVPLHRPVLPGEEMRLTMIVGKAFKVKEEGGARIYQIGGDYPDDRLVTRSVLLPKGAKVLEVDPEPLDQSQTEEGPVVTWRRYFLRGEVRPWRIRYELAN